jgi:hypothetical protein
MSAQVVITNPRSVLQARPHPGPLPQERGNRSPVFIGAEVSGFSRRLETNDMKAATCMVAHRFFSDGQSFSLFPGERAGVRASVSTISSGKESHA